MSLSKLKLRAQGLKTYKVFHMLFKIQFCLTNSPTFLPFLSVILYLSHVFASIMVERII